MNRYCLHHPETKKNKTTIHNETTDFRNKLLQLTRHFFGFVGGLRGFGGFGGFGFDNTRLNFHV
jgi:hypothetical protein